MSEINHSEIPESFTEERPENFPNPFYSKKERLGLLLSVMGYFLMMLGMKPAFFGLDRSPVVGFAQISVFLLGLACLCLGAVTALMAFWPKGHVSLMADFGSRFVATGLVIAVFCGMADVFGIGSHPLSLGIPFFGPLQSKGVVFGEAVISIGIVMMYLPRSKKEIESEAVKDDVHERIDMNE